MAQTDTKREYRYVEHQEKGDFVELSLSVHPFYGEGQWAEDKTDALSCASAVLAELKSNPQAVINLKELGIICKIIGFDAFHEWRDVHTFEEVIIEYENYVRDDIGSAVVYGGDRHSFNGGRTFINVKGKQHYSLYRLSR